jgi:uncharacterized damage-inducible protein DinB
MDAFRDVIQSNLVEYYGVLKRKLEGLTDDELRWQPDPHSNHILWTVWHMSRVEDTWISTLQGRPGIWTAEAWHERLGMTADRHGRGDSLNEVEAAKSLDIAKVMEYYNAVREVTLAHLESMAEKSINREFEPAGWGDRVVTGTWILGHLMAEEAQHLGQVSYIRGMIRGLDG